MHLDLYFFAFAIPAVVFAGMSKGGFGSVASFAATPFLALILTPGQAIGLMLPLLIVMDVTAIKVYWRKWDWPIARTLILGAVPGILLGGALFGFANPDVFRFLIGIVAIGFVIYQLAKSRGLVPTPKVKMGARGGIFWGGVAGFTSFISHAGGPPATVYLLSQKLEKTTFQATSVLVFWAINALKFIPYFALGIFSPETFKADFLLIPAAIAGVFIGAYLHKNISEKLFFGITYVFLVVTGAKLMFDALL
ncbi:sulfite exporter TauE/SafE family protein [Pacificibacter marinus]|uniref:sulfite exporter TauE/SafE family protein n=1 Tax=Pacificibacter marinus TaxID=658057 RepID=UPI001C06A9B7|nr:sulfite exporter TauE/SafE family protein [Pacificibacter marinus]MBU2868760.1 sulfite exporter TauE/SafE family protein [Pacificibacter marinus]